MRFFFSAKSLKQIFSVYKEKSAIWNEMFDLKGIFPAVFSRDKIIGYLKQIFMRYEANFSI